MPLLALLLSLAALTTNACPMARFDPSGAPLAFGDSMENFAAFAPRDALQGHAMLAFYQKAKTSTHPEDLWDVQSPFGPHYLTEHLPATKYRYQDRQRMREAMNAVTKKKTPNSDVLAERMMDLVYTVITTEGAIFRDAVNNAGELRQKLAKEKLVVPPRQDKIEALERQLAEREEYADHLYQSVLAKFLDMDESWMGAVPLRFRESIGESYFALARYWAEKNGIEVTGPEKVSYLGTSAPGLTFSIPAGSPTENLSNKVTKIEGRPEGEPTKIMVIPSHQYGPDRAMEVIPGAMLLRPQFFLLGKVDPIHMTRTLRLYRLQALNGTDHPTPFRGHVEAGSMLPDGTRIPQMVTFYMPLLLAAPFRAAPNVFTKLETNKQRRDLALRLYNNLRMARETTKATLLAATGTDKLGHALLSGLRENNYDLEKWTIQQAGGVPGTTKNEQKFVLLGEPIGPNRSKEPILLVGKDALGQPIFILKTNNFDYRVPANGRDLAEPFAVLAPLLENPERVGPITVEQKEAIVRVSRAIRRNADISVLHTLALEKELAPLEPLFAAYLKDPSAAHEEKLVAGLRNFEEPRIERITAIDRGNTRPVTAVAKINEGIVPPPPLPSTLAQFKKATTDSERRRATEVTGVEAVEAYAEMSGWVVRDRQQDKEGYDLFLFHPKSGKRLHVEVKASRNLDGNIELTPNEVAEAGALQKKGEWALAVVHVDADGKPKIYLTQDLDVGGPIDGDARRPFLIRDVLQKKPVQLTDPDLIGPLTKQTWAF